MIPALLTLLRDVKGDDNRAVARSKMFRENIIQALVMVDQGYDEILTRNSSWAGAVGPAQFMPDSVRRYGVDVNGDGKVNMWDDYREIIPSVAHYLQQKGWKAGQRWGRAVRVPEGLDKSLFTDTLLHQVNKTLDEWAALGVKQSDGAPLPASNDMSAMLIAPNYNVKTGAFSGPFYLVYDNFRTTMEYNKSYRYALTVLQMSDALSAGSSPAPQATQTTRTPVTPYNP
jgi:membrane-bound lytic murein transglycosylase B